jgi:GTPase
LSEPASREKVMVVGIASRQVPRAVAEEHLDELERLVDTAGGQVVVRAVKESRRIDPATYLGRGTVEELARTADSNGVDLVVFDEDLSPAQARNLERSLPRVTDRTGLILEIFGQHARTREARTQVELARWHYLLPRLAGGYRGLSRVGGGIGTRGAGEQQIELDRRKIRRRIAQLNRELERLDTSRRVQRRGRRRTRQVAIAGYTNAGKSTLFSRLTGKDTYAADRLFATLDARVARVPGHDILLIDTVGLIRKLPPDLVASFRSTLAEIREADLVLHVIDASSPRAAEEQRVAEEILDELEVERDRVLPVFTKADLLGEGGRPAGLFVSAVTGDGMESLLARIGYRLAELGGESSNEMVVAIPFSDARAIAAAREAGRVLEERVDETGWTLRLSGNSRRLDPFRRYARTS